MLRVKYTDSADPDFEILIKELDKYLAIIDGEEYAYFSQFNKIDKIKNVIIVYDGEIPVGCGSFKIFSPGIAEIKRMYVRESHRQQGTAALILQKLEEWAKQSNFEECILDTGKKMKPAVQFYLKNGYNIIENFGPYRGVESSVCFSKKLI